MKKLVWAEDDQGNKDYPVVQSRARKLWIPYNGFRLPPPRLIQLLKIAWCNVTDHSWGNGWQIETEDWFKHVAEPEPYAWRGCGRCNLIQRVSPSLTRNLS